MTRYNGLPSSLATRIRARDAHRCRWCGQSAQPIDLHHIRYRRGTSDDILANVISLCRLHHDFVHGALSSQRETIVKEVAQRLLWDLIDLPAVTGQALWRQRKHAWRLAELCEHGNPPPDCYHCLKQAQINPGPVPPSSS